MSACSDLRGARAKLLVVRLVGAAQAGLTGRVTLGDAAHVGATLVAGNRPCFGPS